MLIPFLAATAIAATFSQVGAMSIQISILTVALKALSVALLLPGRYSLVKEGVVCLNDADQASRFAFPLVFSR